VALHASGIGTLSERRNLFQKGNAENDNIEEINKRMSI
jgi:hypothetical protein